MIVIKEELTPAQKKRVDNYKIGDNPNSIAISKHVIPPGTDRIVLPLSDPNDKKLEAPADLSDHLKQHGIEVHDYVNGHAKDKHGRIMKLGKALQQTNAPSHIIEHFNSDPERSNAKQHSNLQVVVSRHPYDVAGMSTNRNWTSCMDFDSIKKGNISNAHYLHHEIKNGTHVAYLTQKGDDTIKNPVARIALKPFVSEDGSHHILRPEGRQYGNAASSFEHTVNGWTNEHFKLKDDTAYRKHQTSYDDGEAEDSVAIKNITNDMVNRNLPNATKHTWGASRASPSGKAADIIQHIAVYGTQEHRHMITDHLVAAGAHVPFGIGYSLIDHGGDEIHQKLLTHPKIAEQGLGDHIAMMGSDQTRHQIINHKNIDEYAIATAVHNMKDKDSLIQHKNHENPIVRKNLAGVQAMHVHMLNDPDPIVRAQIAKTTSNKNHFDHIITDSVKQAHVNSVVAQRTSPEVWGNPGTRDHIIHHATRNIQFGKALRDSIAASVSTALHTQ